MNDIRETSLGRFMASRGTQMLGQTGLKISSKVQIAIGGALTAVGIGFLVAPLFGADPGMAAGAMGPMIGGLANLGTGIAMRKRLGLDKPITIELTPEAKGLLMALHRQMFGWRSPWVWYGPHNPIGVAGGMSPMGMMPPFGYRRYARRARRYAMWSGIHPDMVPESVDTTELEGLERAAHEFNRISGTIAAASAGSATLAKIAPRVSKAADEVMADALHQTAMIAKYPEGAVAARSRLESGIEALRELAERVESLAAEQQNLTDKVAYRSSIDDVLDELRLEQLARSELHQSATTEEPRLRNEER